MYVSKPLDYGLQALARLLCLLMRAFHNCAHFQDSNERDASAEKLEQAEQQVQQVLEVSQF